MDAPVYNTNSFTGEFAFLDPASARTGLALCLTAYVVYGAIALAIAFWRPHEKANSADFFITARNSQSLMWQAGSWFASAMGAWTLYGPASLVSDPYYGTGIVGLIVYSVFTGAPLIMLAYMGSSVRSNVPTATSVGSYAEFRFGKFVQVFVMLLVLFILTMNLLAEYMAIGGIFATFFGCSPYVPLITVGLITMLYTSVGGLFVSIRTDFLQAAVVLTLTLGTIIYMAVSFAGHPLPPLPEYLGATTAGWQTFATLMIPFICGTFFGEGFWQRIWSAENNRSLVLGSWIGGSLASIVVFILGFGGILAYWSGRALVASVNPINSSYSFFYAFADPNTGSISTVVIIIVLIFATIMDESAVDTFQNAITDTLATFAAVLGLKLNPAIVRVLVVVANVPIMVGASYLVTSNVSILNAFGLVNMLATHAFAPLATGLIPQLNAYHTTFSAMGACVGAFAATSVYGVLHYGDAYTGFTALWWTSVYDYLGFITAFVASIVCIPLFIGIEFGVRAAFGWQRPMPFDPKKLVGDDTAHTDVVDKIGVHAVKAVANAKFGL
ncbi:hypothetical protein HDU81_009700 [Chytriomyces hyalinus]|nr:hypothetical protein HDU81_009700 [Chytriomyces hyalinus]